MDMLFINEVCFYRDLNSKYRKYLKDTLYSTQNLIFTQQQPGRASRHMTSLYSGIKSSEKKVGQHGQGVVNLLTKEAERRSDWPNKNIKQFLILLLVLAVIIIIYIGLYGTGEIKHNRMEKYIEEQGYLD